MDTTTAQLVQPADPLFDEARLATASTGTGDRGALLGIGAVTALGGFLARYSGSTRSGYACDLRAWFAWCSKGNLDVFAVRRVHVELYAR